MTLYILRENLRITQRGERLQMRKTTMDVVYIKMEQKKGPESLSGNKTRIAYMTKAEERDRGR